MKNIKALVILAVTICMVEGTAQEKSIDLFAVPLSNPQNPGKLVIDQISGSISVEAYDGKEVVIKASFGGEHDHDDGHREKNGLKRINSSSLNIGAEEKDNVVHVINEQWNKATHLHVKVPKAFSVKLSTVNDGDISVKGISGEMEITNVNGEIVLEGVSGSATADTVNGDVKVDFQSITQDANMAFSSLNGDLDITFPNSLKANVKAKTDMGDIYTDFDMKVAANQPEVNQNSSSGTYKVKIEQWVRGTINGGGPEMLFKTFNGDILIKSK
ncbi:DUF4097 family beta strand repeat-containing protein [Flagellimonas sp.]|uniref:DUF4097 family beta strand repeat-containing protein n=1 Tax=Flagellimonas sp. TaxID=2058762 RepID=UPI003BAED53B